MSLVFYNYLIFTLIRNINYFRLVLISKEEINCFTYKKQVDVLRLLLEKIIETIIVITKQYFTW